MRNMLPNRSPRDLSDTVQWLNSSGETVPAYGVVKLFSYDDVTNQYQADKPDGQEGIYYANGGVSIGSDKYSGSQLWNLPRRCLVDSSSYDVGDVVGPVSGQWGMGSQGTGWRILRPPNAGNVAVVQRDGGSGASAIHGIVHDDIGCGYYVVELAEWAGQTPTGGSGSGTGSQDGLPCDVCPTGSGSQGLLGNPNCGDATIPIFENQVIGIGVFVLAYDPASVLVPLQEGSDCLMMDTGATNLTNGSGSGTGFVSEDREPVFQIIRGYQTHTVQYIENEMCCDGEIIATDRKALIFAAKMCENMFCDTECPGGA
jgi:hypothetical protein